MGKGHIVHLVAAHVVKCERIENVLYININRNIKTPSDVYVLLQESISQLSACASKQDLEGLDLTIPQASKQKKKPNCKTYVESQCFFVFTTFVAVFCHFSRFIF